jgi:chorismate synthase
MSGNTFGELFQITTFGESHGPALGAVVSGVPAGLKVDAEFIQRELDRRRPGSGIPGTTARREADRVKILSGVFKGVATGTPIAFVIENTDQHSADYDRMAGCFRPGHADFTYLKKYGIRDWRGGGRASGRETAARVGAGALAKLLLREYRIEVAAGVESIGAVKCETADFSAPGGNELNALDPAAVAAMREAIAAAARDNDSLGGVVRCRVTGVPAGLGEPVFDKLDALVAHAVMSIGAVKGIEFGAGFGVSELRGSVDNDPITPEGFATNRAGGVLGGISTGAALEFRAAVKPTPSIGIVQRTIDTSGKAAEITVGGRHDVCIAPRIVPVVEAMTALVLADLLLIQRARRI